MFSEKQTVANVEATKKQVWVDVVLTVLQHPSADIVRVVSLKEDIVELANYISNSYENISQPEK